MQGTQGRLNISQPIGGCVDKALWLLLTASIVLMPTTACKQCHIQGGMPGTRTGGERTAQLSHDNIRARQNSNCQVLTRALQAGQILKTKHRGSAVPHAHKHEASGVCTRKQTPLTDDVTASISCLLHAANRSA